MNIRDRVSSFFNVQARSSGHIGASRTSRAGAMNGMSYGPHTVVADDHTLLKNRSQDGIRNFPYPKNAIRKLVSHEIGSGIKPKFNTRNDELDKALALLWEDSCREIVNGPDGNFYAAQRLCSRARNESGEVFIRRRRRSRQSSDLTVPVQIEILESDYLDITDNRILPNGNKVRSGIEFNRSNSRVAYHFFREHPNEWAMFGNGSAARKVRVLAKDVIHHFIPLRPGQQRGVPVNTASLFKSANLEKYDDFELSRKQNQSAFTGTIEREARYTSDGSRMLDPLTGKPYELPPEGEEQPRLKMNSGQFVHLSDGEKLTLFNGDKGGEFYADYMRQALLSVSADHGVMYELVTGDWKNTTDRLYRAAMDDFKREIEAIQELYMIAQVCQKVEAWWIDSVVVSGVLRISDYSIKRKSYLRNDWIPQGWPYMHPLQDAQAAAKLIENDLTTHAREGRKHSVDTDKALVENVAHRKKKQELEAAAELSSEDDDVG